MIKTNLFDGTGVSKIVNQKGIFSVLEYDRDISVSAQGAMQAYFSSKMNLKKKQVIAKVNDVGVVTQAGSMQMMLGDVKAATNVKGAGDLFKKAIGSAVTKESAIKPKYVGDGTIVLEPTYKYILLEDIGFWHGQMVVEDGMYLASEGSVEISVTARSNISSAVMGNEGLFNTNLKGSGVVALESPVPAEELIIVDLENDTLKIDGSLAIAWSNTLQFTVERTTKTLIGSAATQEGLVNVYRGTGRVLVAPVR